MSEGRVEQIGTPSEIYNFPATAFVASFVGTLNLMPAAVVDPASGRVVVAGQEIRTARAIGDAKTGDQITMALRPEGISLGEGEPDANRLRGTIDDISFLGSIVRLRMGVARSDGTVNEISLDTFNEPHLSLPAIGSTVTVSFPPEACFVLAGSVGAPVPTIAEAGAAV
jgi:putative spermidine/putrescine transport system ATP-binding protein